MSAVSTKETLDDAHARIAQEYGDDAVNIPSLSAAKINEDSLYNQPITQDEKTEAEISKLPADQQKYVRDNAGIGGALRVGAESAVNELGFGLPELAYRHFADPNDVAQHDALKHVHDTANVIGGGVGALGSLAIGGPIFKGAAEAGRLGEAAVLGGRAAEDTSLARTIASKLIGGAAEGAVIGSPSTVGNLAFGDPKAAAENLMFSAGIGGLLGPASFGIKKALEFGSDVGGEIASRASNKLDSFIKDPDPLLSQFGDVNKSSLAGAQITDAGRSAVDTTLGNLVKKSLRYAGLSVGGPLGYIKGELAGNVAKEAISLLPDSAKTLGLQATLKASQLAEKQLSRIPDILSGLSDSKFIKSAASSGSIFGEMGKEVASGKDDHDSFNKLSNKLAQDTANMQDVDVIGRNSAGLSHNAELQTEYQMASLNAINYLKTIIPKNPNPVLPFTPQAPWKPNDLQLAQFKSQLDIVHNPYSVLDKLEAGTVTKQDVDTLKNVYPAIYGNITQEILKHSTDPKYANLSYQAKNKLSLLTGIPMNNDLNPASINALQSNFTQDAAKSPDGGSGGNPKGSKKALSNNPSMSTETQNIAAGLTGTGQVK